MRLWKEPCCVRGIGCASQRSSLTRQRKRTCGRRATSGTYVTCWSFASPDDGCGKAKGLALRALERDRGLGEAHASLAWAAILYDYDFVTAEREFERSIELNPRYATAHQWFGLSLGFMGRYEEGFTELKRAIRLDPHSMMIQ